MRHVPYVVFLAVVAVGLVALGCGESHSSASPDGGAAADDGALPVPDGAEPAVASCERAVDLAGAGVVAPDGSFRWTTRIGDARHGLDGSCGHGPAPEIVARYVPPHDGRLELTTSDDATSFDTILYVRTACARPGAELACDDDGGSGTASRVLVTVHGGEPIWIVADGYGDVLPDDTLGLRGTLHAIVPIGDTCEAPEPLVLGADGVATATGDTTSAGPDVSATCGRADEGADRVYALTLRETSTVRLTLTPADGFDAVLHVHDGCGVGARELACSDGVGEEIVLLPEVAPGTYLIVVDGYGADAAGSYTLRAALLDSASTCDAPAPLATPATTLPDGSMLVRGDTSTGSRAIDSTCTSSETGPEVVYTYTPAADGLLLLTTDRASTTADTVLYVREACARASSELACDDDGGSGLTSSLSVPVHAGVPLAIVVDTAIGGDGGPFELAAELVAGVAPPVRGGESCDVAGMLRPAGAHTRIALGAGDTVGARSDRTGSCGSSETAPDQAFALVLGERRDVSIDLHVADGYDAVVYVTDGCGALAREAACSDTFGDEHLELPALAAGTYYVFVDGFRATDAGAYELRVTTTSLDP